MAKYLADGKLFYMRKHCNHGSRNIYDLDNAADSTNGGGIKVTLNRDTTVSGALQKQQMVH